MLFDKINDYVTMFLKENGDQTILGVWNDNLEDFKEKFQTKVNKKAKKAKKSKDAPKGALSAYILFGKEVRDQIKEDEPDFDSKEIMREQGRRWAKLKDENTEEIDRLNLLAKQDKARYNKEMENYTPVASDDEENDKNDKKKRAKKDPNAPRGAKNAYLYYCEANRSLLKEDNPDMTGKEIQKELAEQWKALKEEEPEEAEIYIKMANDDKERFVAENAEYIEKNGVPEKIAKDTKKVAKKGKVQEKVVAKVPEKKAVKKIQEKVVAKVAEKKVVKKVVAKVPEKKIVKKVAKKVIDVSEDEDDEDDDDE
jgi:hypothetical protein